MVASKNTRGSAKGHAALSALIRGRIESGDLKIGDTMPTEDQLCAEYRVTRYTLRQALSELERDGLIERRRRAGTKVIAQTSRPIYRHAVSSRNELLSFVSGTTVKFAPPKMIETDAKLSRVLGCDEFRRWNLLQGIRVEADTGHPIGVTSVYIDAARITLPPDLDLDGIAVYQWIQDTYGIRVSSVSQDISAILLTEHDAEALGERAGAAALYIARRYFDEQQRMYMIAVTTHRSEQFVYNMRFRFDE